MGVSGTLIRYSSQGKGKKRALETMYFLEGGLLMISNLLQTHSWVNDELRTHCSVCIQQFLPFRRRHHCRTCGEVVCGGCSSQRIIRLTDINVECETRVCTFCIIRATDASIKANEASFKENQLEHERISTPSIPSLSSPLYRRRKQITMFNVDSEHTLGFEGSQPKLAYESAQVKGTGKSKIRSAQLDPTMKLLVSVVARTLKCPGAFIGITDDLCLRIKASVGMDDNVTHIPKCDCLCLCMLLQNSTVIVDDTNPDRHFHERGLDEEKRSLRYYAGTPVRVGGHAIGVLCAFDTKPHSQTKESMKSTLEAVASIVSEVLEQRAALNCMPKSFIKAEDGADLYQRLPTTANIVDLRASLLGLNLSPTSQSALSLSQGRDRDATRLFNQYTDKITATMDYFHQLQRSAWVERNILPQLSIDKSIRTFKLFRNETKFTRSVMKVAADCFNVVNGILDYKGAFLYQQIFSHVSTQDRLSGQTSVYRVTLHSSFGTILNESFQILTHHREYPDGSNVVVATGMFNTIKAGKGDLLFGWFVAPNDRGNKRSTINVSCITAQSFQNQTRNLNLSLDLLRRLKQKLMTHPTSEKLTSMKPSVLQNEEQSANQRGHGGEAALNDSGIEEKADRKERTANSVNFSGHDDPSGDNKIEKLLPECNLTAFVAVHEIEQASQRNQNELLLLDLLEKTISTQDILAERQDKMVGLIVTHDNQLERISSALSNVDHILDKKRASNCTLKKHD